MRATTLGLGNVDNTSDGNKPIGSAQATVLNARQGRQVDDGHHHRAADR